MSRRCTFKLDDEKAQVHRSRDNAAAAGVVDGLSGCVVENDRCGVLQAPGCADGPGIACRWD